LGFCYREYGQLRTVLMHAPGQELQLVHPTTFTKCLFADAVDPEQFREDHQRFVDVLQSEGVKVHLLTQVLRDRRLLATIQRLPNLVYVRDTAAVTRRGYVLGRMRSPVRRRETKIVEAALNQLDIPMLMKPEMPSTIECGDLVFLDDDTLLLGVGNRSNLAGLRQLITSATNSGLQTLVSIPLPPWAIHLDGTMMVLDRDLAIVHKPCFGSTASVFRNGQMSKRLNFLQFLKAYGMKLVKVTDYERQRRATNVVAIGPRKVVGYAGNSRVKRELVQNGVDFIEIEGAELIRGYGGPRCMTMPILRD
jgi:arginine deiminase